MGDGDKRRARASKHASRSRTCACGRTVWGNGGWSSHKRACRTYKVQRALSLDQLLIEHPTISGYVREQWRNELVALRKELDVS